MLKQIVPWSWSGRHLESHGVWWGTYYLTWLVSVYTFLFINSWLSTSGQIRGSRNTSWVSLYWPRHISFQGHNQVFCKTVNHTLQCRSQDSASPVLFGIPHVFTLLMLERHITKHTICGSVLSILLPTIYFSVVTLVLNEDQHTTSQLPWLELPEADVSHSILDYSVNNVGSLKNDATHIHVRLVSRYYVSLAFNYTHN